MNYQQIFNCQLSQFEKLHKIWVNGTNVLKEKLNKNIYAKHFLAFRFFKEKKPKQTKNLL